MRDQDRRSGLDLARAIGILGGLITLIAGVLIIISPLESRRSLPGLDVIISIVTYGFLVIVLGLVALFASMRLSSLGWSIFTIGVGLLAYRFGADFLYGLGPILLVVAGIVGIIVKFG